MDKSHILLSICIPTFKRGKILTKTLESIYSQSNVHNFSNFEVIVTDNDPEYENELYISNFNKYDNFHYFKNNSKGFLNSLEALKKGKGSLLKLHNIQMKFKKGSLNKILRIIKNNLDKKPLLFFSNGVLRNYQIQNYDKFNKFIYSLSFQCSWSAGFSLWFNDRQILDANNLNKTFPQTSLIFLCDKKLNYVVDDTNYFSMQYVSSKGGYNIFEVFGTNFLDMMEKYFIEKKINYETLEKIKLDLSKYFFPKVIFKNLITRIENFETKNFIQHLNKHYNKISITKMIFRGLFVFTAYFKIGK